VLEDEGHHDLWACFVFIPGLSNIHSDFCLLQRIDWSSSSSASAQKDCILLAACEAHQSLPQSAEFPADVFTACLTTPIKMALHWFSFSLALSSSLFSVCAWIFVWTVPYFLFSFSYHVVLTWGHTYKPCRFCKRSLLHGSLDLSLIDQIPGRQNDRKTLLGELNWIFTAITDTIAWNVLPHGMVCAIYNFGEQEN
jgi:regulator-associated protein of mTOR